MKTLSRIPLLFLLSFSFVVSASAALQAGNDENINYQWSFVAKVGSGAERKAVMVTRDTMLRSGDEFKMMVNLQKKAFVYVIHKSPSNELSLLYPTTFEAVAELEKNYYLPKGRSWFKLDEKTGTETFYVLAATERLGELEQQMNAYLAASNDQKGNLANTVVATIKDIKKKFRTYATLGERPISIAGNVRGTKKDETNIDKLDVATLATEISANNFYSKTFTIEHK